MKTLQKVRELLNWNNVRSDAEKFCRIRDRCAARKGPLPRTSGGNNNSNPLSGLLHQVAFFPTKMPQQLQRTTALHPQSDGMVERFNRTILNSLSLLVSSNQHDWDKKLPFFLLAYRISVHETTGYSPSQMPFERDLRLPTDLLFSRQPDAPLVPEEYFEKLQAWMEEIHHLARERISMASEKMKTRYNARTTGHDFHEGDEVWLWNPKLSFSLSLTLSLSQRTIFEAAAQLGRSFNSSKKTE
ncbi:retrovirus-related Pol polyprotein from transposon 412 [Trichonephila clavipes]|nr:retrovirus-related Pol polyprotein from transposon 412 [Trichonephila clavipes]